MSVKYELTIIVHERNLPTILEVLNGTADIKSIVPHNVENGESSHQQKPRAFRYANGVKTKQKPSSDAVMEVFVDNKTHTRTEVQKNIVKYGYAESSASPIISTLVKEGKLKRTVNGMIQKS